MKKTNDGMPTANIAINKSRLKMYTGDFPTYYLKKGQEFQIELFNPTKGTILCKIYLNATAIAQGGLILRPGERVFLDRYIDVAKKFKFDTYEVSGKSSEVKKAIEDNGDFKVEFFQEIKKRPVLRMNPPTRIYNKYSGEYKERGTGNFQNYSTNTLNYNDSGIPYPNDITFTTNNTGVSNISNTTDLANTFNTTSFYDVNQQLGGDLHDGMATMDWMEPTLSRTINDKSFDPSKVLRSKAKKSKKIETGRVEEGSKSDQEMVYVTKDWAYIPFHTVEYKLLPISQRVNTTQDISVKRYCTSCGKKSSKGDNFCGKCGNKI